MKVFTHYTNLTTKADGVRWRTLLQFGNSWEIKGSVVMKNPGASNFKNLDHSAITSSEILEELKAFDDNGIKAEWYEFNPDPTMKCIGTLFSEYYAAKGQKLDGVIQIFNLFYLREADLGKALDKALKLGFTDMADYDIEHLKAPVYLGFADLAWHKVYGQVAQKFFCAAFKLGMAYLNNDFNKNPYTHPLYLMMYGKNKPKCIQTRCQFYQNTTAPILSQEMLDMIKRPAKKLNKEFIMDRVVGELDKHFPLAPKEEKNHRYLFDSLELTISAKENGFVGFRHPRNVKCYFNYISEIVPKEYQYRDTFSIFGFDTEKSEEQKSWLARKLFEDYGSEELSIADSIIDELKQIHNKLSNMGNKSLVVSPNESKVLRKIYFAGSIRGGRVDADLYKRMIAYIKQTDMVLTEHIGKSNMSLNAQTKAIDTHIYERDTEWLRSADMVIAECTCPSLGVGYELAYAEAHGIPVHIFYDKGKSNISAMLNGNTYFTIHPYESEEEIYTEMDTILHK